MFIAKLLRLGQSSCLAEEWFTEDPKEKGWLNRNVLGTGLVSLLSDASHEMVTALLPIFITLSSALGGLGANAAVLGTIEGLSDGLSSFTKPIAGHLSDRTKKRKPWMVAGYTATAVLLPAIALIQNVLSLAALRISAWAGRGMRGPPRDALLSDSVEPKHYGKAFGLHRAMDSIGAIVGPVLAFLMLPLLGVRGTMLLAFIPGLLSVLVVVFLIKEVKVKTSASKSFKTSIQGLPKRFRYLIAAQAVFGVGNFANVLFVLAAMEILTPSLGALTAASIAVGLYALLNAIYAAMSFPVGVLADRHRKHILLGFGYLFNALACIILALWSQNLILIGLAFVAVGLQLAFTDTIEGALAAELLPKDISGTGFGALQFVDGVGDLISSTVVGILWVVFSPVVGLIYSALLSLLAFALILRLMRIPASG
ncbi:MAG: MFS transporter [Methanomassiliicoccales archaeon]